MTVATDTPVSRAPDLEDGPPASPPRFIHTMQKAEVIEGSAARFDVTLAGSPEPEVQWLKDDKPLKKNRKFRFEQEDDGVFSLFVNDVEADDEGIYKCVASNIKGEVSCEAELIVEGKLLLLLLLFLFLGGLRQYGDDRSSNTCFSSSFSCFCSVFSLGQTNSCRYPPVYVAWAGVLSDANIVVLPMGVGLGATVGLGEILLIQLTFSNLRQESKQMT